MRSLFEEVNKHIEQVIQSYMQRGMFRYIPLNDGSTMDLVEEQMVSRKMMKVKAEQDGEVVEKLAKRIKKLEDRTDFVDSLARQRALQALSAISRQLFQKYMKENIAQIKHMDGIIELFADDSMIDSAKSSNHILTNGGLQFNEDMASWRKETLPLTVSSPTATIMTQKAHTYASPALYSAELGGTLYTDGLNRKMTLYTDGNTYGYQFPDATDTPYNGYPFKGKDGRFYYIAFMHRSRISTDPLYNKPVPGFTLYDISDIKTGVVTKLNWEDSIFAKSYEAYVRTIKKTDGTYQGVADIFYSPVTDKMYGVGLITKTQSEIMAANSNSLSTTSSIIWVVDNKTGEETVITVPSNLEVSNYSGGKKNAILTPKGNLYITNRNGGSFKLDVPTNTWTQSDLSISTGQIRLLVENEVWIMNWSSSVGSMTNITIYSETSKIVRTVMLLSNAHSSLIFPKKDGVIVPSITSSTMEVFTRTGTSIVQLKPFTTTENATGVLLSLSGEFDDVVKNNTIQVSADNGATWVTPEFEYYDGMYEAYLDGSKHKTILIRCTFKYEQKKRMWNALGVMWI